jgi:hypothetical protein
MNYLFRSFALVAGLFAAAAAHALDDPPGGVLPTFTGDRSIGALDILSSDVTFDSGANVFRVHAHTAGNIADAASAAYVFGFNRGGATNSPFADIGVPSVTFDATALLRANGTGLSGATPLTARVDGADIFATIDASVLPSKGFAPEDFTWALWSIDSQIQGNFRNADFAPDANVQVATVPEPETYALMLGGLGVVGFIGRRRSRAVSITEASPHRPAARHL